MTSRMSKIVLPEDMTILYLVRLPQTAPPAFRKARSFVDQSPRYAIDELWRDTRYLLQHAQAQRKYFYAALARLYESDLHRRAKNLDAAKASARQAKTWLSMQLRILARYHEGIADYQLGLLDYLQGRKRPTYQHLTTALQLLDEVKALWIREGGHTHLEDCRDLCHWITNILILYDEVYAAEDKMVIPVYEADDVGEDVKYHLVEAVAVSQGRLTTATVDRPAQVREGDEGYALHYFAVRVKRDRQYVRESKPGDLVIVQRTSASPAVDAASPSSKTSPVSTPKREFEFHFPYGEIKGEPRLIMGGEEEQ